MHTYSHPNLGSTFEFQWRNEDNNFVGYSLTDPVYAVKQLCTQNLNWIMGEPSDFEQRNEDYHVCTLC